MIVVDASLAVKWMLWEADSPRAIDFLRRHGPDLCGPDLLFTEVASAIVRYANMHHGIASDAFAALQKWTISWGEHAVRPHRVTQRRLYEAGKLAFTLRHPLKDCIYLALAMELRCPLATCDAKFRDRAIESYGDIHMLADFAAS